MKMVKCAIVAAGMGLAGSIVWAGPPDARLHTPPVVATIRSKLPSGWSCEGDHVCVVIRRHEPVTELNLIGLPGSASEEQILREFGLRTHYQIALVFKPRLSEVELRGLKTLRAAAIQRAKASDDAKRSQSSQAARKFDLPVYFDGRFSVYVYRTDDGPIGIYPKEAARERDVVLGILEAMFQKY